MLGLITDRSYSDVTRLKNLSEKMWDEMTTAEQAEWMADPLNESGGVNLIPQGPYYSSSVDLTYRNRYIVATAVTSGTYLYAVSIIGDASDYEGKTFTLSASDMGSSDGGTPQIALYWHDDNGYEHTGAALTGAGSVTFTVNDNSRNRAYLAMYVYVTTDTSVSAGTSVRYSEVMLEVGSVRHDYVPYTPILPNPVTKGAYNYSDLNRVERTVAEVAEYLGLDLQVKTDWGIWDIPTQTDMERYIGNIRAIWDVCPNIQDELSFSDNVESLAYSRANTIEQILEYAWNKVDAGCRCGEIYCGEV